MLSLICFQCPLCTQNIAKPSACCGGDSPPAALDPLFHPSLGPPRKLNLRGCIPPRLHWLLVCSWVWSLGGNSKSQKHERRERLGYLFPDSHLTSAPWVSATENPGPALSFWQSWEVSPSLLISFNPAYTFVSNPLNKWPFRACHLFLFVSFLLRFWLTHMLISKEL